MKIAFTSCTCAGFISNQLVWDSIREAKPDHVVLLGDSFYNDVPSPGIDALLNMKDDPFARHLHSRYMEQLANPRFREMVAAPGITVHAIWDDHDFAWDDAEGGELMRNPEQAGKVKISTSMMREFRRVLAAKDLSLFPTEVKALAFWEDTLAKVFKPLGATSIPLEPGGRSWLHLTDGRTQRRKKTMLGSAQRAQLTEAFNKHPDALHIIASGGTFKSSDCWANYKDDFAWLEQCIGARTWMMLSGDVHNINHVNHRLSGGGWLVEATASGAGSKAWLNPIFPGPELRNHGMLELTPTQVRLDLFSFDVAAKPDLIFKRHAGGGLEAPV